ncbi:DsbA family oxidoreductase [Kyrpidia tusciae]|uniref:DSBA oxidoreductase n=1 Tax=Kyrpidia tusciae (strain DSM 2912 / NBRC 15312 / T2) TaxID=562970 RepID=D5WQ19_KYRT2|nr:DsbA family protein [Kyrpidia tusciae]ADG06428.1 DSBA oxidoreductase [Kyrpidia tusciae DSM 2912]
MKIEFFHDVLCAWCYVISPRVRQLAEEFPDVEIVHRSFALAPGPEDIGRMFGSKERAKREILNHWKAANANDDERRIRAELMETRDFDYPHSLPGLMACKAAEFQGGQRAHWDYFDRVQKAHLTECRNIADGEVLLDCAGEVGLDVERFEQDFQSDRARQAVEDDVRRARELGIRAVPSLVGTGSLLVGAQRYDSLKTWYINQQDPR